MSLGRLDHAQGRLREARHRLASVYERFTEGVETPDLQAPLTRSIRQLLGVA